MMVRVDLLVSDEYLKDYMLVKGIKSKEAAKRALRVFADSMVENELAECQERAETLRSESD